ncbi:protein bric-a-brac 2-like isoform X1 [Amphibalanus amphitrite]|uniref:protein bric-a-brac 2-like isoform X1 n=1 Tax=Amphibalanus amphitrite TaxID=1232801 RepID=UPI001C915356|nr:protein bric-a-brac 2-like isoform X1 [Amphibalanus amphitrite]
MMDSQKFCLKWDGFQSSVTSVFDHLRRDGELVDITLCCEGQRVKAHRMMLSACSPYFRELLKDNPCQQMVFFLKDTSAEDLSAIIEFMYKGSVNVSQTQLASFIRTAEMLQIKGLSGDEEKMPPSPTTHQSPGRAASHEPRPMAASTPQRPHRNGTPPAKRRRASETVTETPPHQPPSSQPPSTPSQQSNVLPQNPPRMPSSQPSPPPSSSTPLAASSNPASAPVQTPAGHPTEGGQAIAEESIKVEKVDLTEEEDDDATLDSTLDYVADYEGGYRDGPDLSMADAAAIMGGGGGGGVAGPSQRPPDDGSQSDQRLHVCNVCGKSYKHRESLNHHRKKHEGLTTCFVCGKVCCIVAELRRHLELNHGLTQEEVRRFVPTKPKERIMQAPFRAAGMLQPTLGAAQGMMPMAAPSAAQFKPSVRAGFEQAFGRMKRGSTMWNVETSGSSSLGLRATAGRDTGDQTPVRPGGSGVGTERNSSVGDAELTAESLPKQEEGSVSYTPVQHRLGESESWGSSDGKGGGNSDQAAAE